MTTVSYTEARARLADLLDRVTDDRETVIVNRRGHEPVAMIAADDLDSLLETVHLLRSRTNAERLLTSLARAKSREGSETSLDALKAELELDEG